MKITDDHKVVLDNNDDFEFIKLINLVIKTEFGEMKIKIRDAKPYQVIEMTKNILLKRD